MTPMNKLEQPVNGRTITFYFGIRFLRSLFKKLDVDFEGLFALYSKRPFDAIIESMLVSANCKGNVIDEDELLDFLDSQGGIKGEFYLEFQRYFMWSLGVDPDAVEEAQESEQKKVASPVADKKK